MTRTFSRSVPQEPPRARTGTKSCVVVALFAAAVTAASFGVFAHGDEHHDESYGKPGDSAKVSRTATIDMSDTMRFTPTSIAVRKGETIRFVVKNSGKVKHEMVLGSIKELREHATLMLKFPEMEHDEPNELSVEPGKTGELIWQFTKAGTFDFACLRPGHFEAGMRGRIVVK